MTTSNSLLVELFVEELPPKALRKLGDAFANTLADSLKAQGLAGADSVVTPYASPRRLAAHISNVVKQAPDREVRQKLMPPNVGIDTSGMPTPALVRKMQTYGVEPSLVQYLVLALENSPAQMLRNSLDAVRQQRLERSVDGKAEALFFWMTVEGATLADGLQKALDEALAKLPIPKVMTYQLADGWTSVNFVRPAHGLVALHGDEVVPVSVLGLTSGRETKGHRFEAANPQISIRDANSYESQMEIEGAVIPNYEKRSLEIVKQLRTSAARLGVQLEIGRLNLIGDEEEVVLLEDALIQEVTSLVERPNVLVGHFDEAFLEVPQECLILTMKTNQKYFPLFTNSARLTNQFLIVSNISPADPSQVIGGNERVVRPRLADAKFFFDQDRKKTLASRVEALDKVVYHNKLGSQGARSQKVQLIAAAIASLRGGKDLEAHATLAASLAKTDLLTDMVGEFPELQGIMGRYYALNDGLSSEVADAIEDHYKPRFAGDELPRNEVGLCVALADKLETLVGLFGIGQVPTGDKDPFALRRHALGVIRILMERDLPLHLDALLAVAAGVRGFPEAVAVQVGAFMFERLSGLLREQGYTAQEVDAVVSQRPQRLGDIPKRLAAVREFAALPEAESLAAANKRVGNILKKVEGTVEPVTNPYLLQEAAEIALNAALAEVEPVADAAFDSGDYAASLKSLAALKAPVDDFFDGVMVNVEDVNLRNNRLGLLARLHRAMNRVADLSRLAA